MKLKKLSYILIFISIIMFNSGISLVNGETTLKNLANGSIVRTGWDYYRNEATGDPYGIEWTMNVSWTKVVNFTSLSTSFYNSESVFA